MKQAFLNLSRNCSRHLYVFCFVSLEDLGVVKNDDLLLRVKYTGHVEWEPPVLLATHCKVK